MGHSISDTDLLEYQQNENKIRHLDFCSLGTDAWFYSKVSFEKNYPCSPAATDTHSIFEDTDVAVIFFRAMKYHPAMPWNWRA